MRCMVFNDCWRHSLLSLATGECRVSTCVQRMQLSYYALLFFLVFLDARSLLLELTFLFAIAFAYYNY